MSEPGTLGVNVTITWIGALGVTREFLRHIDDVPFSREQTDRQLVDLVTAVGTARRLLADHRRTGETDDGTR